MKKTDSILFMRAALEEAAIAARQGEIPVGAVIVRDGEIIAAAHNENRKSQNPVRHAEIICIEKAASVLGNERLTDCELYVSLEPCAMCAGAIIHARIAHVYIAAEDLRYGACGSALSVCGNKILNHIPEIVTGILKEESSSLLKCFFRELREKK